MNDATTQAQTTSPEEVTNPAAPTPPAGGSYLVDPVTGVLTLVACTQPATVL